MPQNVPEFRFGDDALRVRQFLYEHWCAHGRGPNLRAVHAGTGLSRERIIAAYRELELGIMCTVHPHAQNSNLLKAPPFSSYPTQAELHVDGRFHCWAGCAMESARGVVTPTGKSRMWQYDRAPDYIRPEKIIAGIRALGVDTSPWEA